MIIGKPRAAHRLITTAMATISSIAVLAAAPAAQAQSTFVPPCTAGCSTPTVPTAPTPPATIPTPPPVVVVPTPPPPPPPVVVVSTPTPPPMPTPPQGMFMNVPSDMRTMTQLDSITSINRLIRDPGTVSLSIPRQAQPNRLENRTLSGAETGMESERAIQALESAKPLI